MKTFIVHINEYRKHRADIEVLFINSDGAATRKKTTVSTLFSQPKDKARIVADKLIAKWERKLNVKGSLVTYIIE